MPLYVISWKDRPDSLDLRMAVREAHLAHVAAQNGRVRLAGPHLDAGGRMIGSLMILEADSLEDARAFHASDPYVAAGLVDEADIGAWRPTVGALA